MVTTVAQAQSLATELSYAMGREKKKIVIPINNDRVGRMVKLKWHHLTMLQ